MNPRTPIWPLLGVMALLAGCGQTGRLYLPETQGEVVTRPAPTPPPETEGTSNSTQSVDSPAASDTPTPEVTEPEAGKNRKDGAKIPPPTRP